jgi:Fe-S cluster biosynthesis and repair protein YggX
MREPMPALADFRQDMLIQKAGQLAPVGGGAELRRDPPSGGGGEPCAQVGSIQKLGEAPPAVENEAEAPDASELAGDQVIDRRTGRPGTKMADPPMRGELGAFIAAHYSQETWQEWIGMGTKVINALSLAFSNLEHPDVYDQHMREWLGIGEGDVEAWAAQEKKGK